MPLEPNAQAALSPGDAGEGFGSACHPGNSLLYMGLCEPGDFLPGHFQCGWKPLAHVRLQSEQVYSKDIIALCNVLLSVSGAGDGRFTSHGACMQEYTPCTPDGSPGDRAHHRKPWFDIGELAPTLCLVGTNTETSWHQGC